MATFSSIDEQISALSAVQGGYIHRDQLAQLGLTASAIRNRIRRGFLIPSYRSVYAVGHIPADPISRAKGALLAAGPRSALGDISAGSYYGIFKHWRFPLHVIVATDHRIKGLIIHRNRRLTRKDVVTPEPNLRVVSPLIALLESAPYLSERRLKRVVNEIRLQHRIQLSEVQDALNRFPRHPGVPVLASIVATSQQQPNRSAWEDEWPEFAAHHHLPAYVMNHRVEGHRTDVLFPVEELIVELDGWATHQTHEAFIKDRAQDAEILARTGMPTVRITYERFHQRTNTEAERLHTILERRRAELQLRAAPG
jgi:very-short-patch-repair endonuclease